MNENYITRKVKEHLQELRSKYGVHFYFQKISDRFTDGIPDYYISYRGKSLWLELKAPGERPRPLQTHVLNRLGLAGNTALWADSVQDAIRIIDDFVSN